MLGGALEALLEEPIDWRYKGLPPTRGPLTLRDLGGQGWNVLAGDFLLPVMVLKESALAHNIRSLATLCRERGVSLAPHGKTTMAPQIMARQLEAGAWGVTAATASQARAFRGFGVERILLANELVEPAALHWVAAELAADPGFDFLCLADSEEGVTLMHDALARAGTERPLRVLVELGATGTRTGARSDEQARAVAAAVSDSAHLQLAGVEGYEGVIGEQRRSDATLTAIDSFLERVRAFTVELDRAGAFDGRGEIVVTAGGSAFFDRVLAGLDFGGSLERPVRMVLRSGCYVTHDAGVYGRISPLRPGGEEHGSPLRAALEVWGVVLSRPEPGLAIVGVGKRDAPQDVEPPIPQQIVRRSGERVALRGELTVTGLMDQHAFVRVEPGRELAVGDLVGFGISHPCTAFDKWRLILVVDDDYGVTGGIRTFF